MHITLHDYSNPGFILYQTKRHFLLQTQQKTIPHQYILSIDRLTGKCDQITQKQFFDVLRNQQPLGQKLFWAVYGIIVVEEIPYLTLVKDTKLVTSQRQNPIFEIKELSFIKFDPDKQKIQSGESKQILDFINSDLVTGKFYFSYTQDLTQCFKKQMKHSVNQFYESKFFWNQKNVEFLKVNAIKKPWIVPIIQGYVGSITQNHLEYRIIARRSKHMSGTRYNNRGINLQGLASNFVEIQERIQYNNMIFSFLILRGSVPLYWKQQGGFSSIQFPDVEDKCLKGLKKHYDNLAIQYQSTINTINLLSVIKLRQKPLVDRFFNILSSYGGQKTYYAFDFNKQPQNLHQNIQNFVTSYELKQSQNNFQCYQIKNQKKIYQQNNIPRVNCLDCIDRTNVICCRIGQCFVKKVMRILNFSYSQIFHTKYLQEWKNIGNQISLIYCGTASVAQHLTLKQQASYWSSLTSSWRSVTRFLNANQSDEWKEQCNLYLLRQHQKSITTYFGDNIVRLNVKPNNYCTFFQTDIAILTWNVGAISSKQLSQADKINFSKQIFGQQHEKSPAIIFVTLQQIVQLNSYNVVTNDNSAAKKDWQQTFFSILNHFNTQNAGFTYTLYFSQALVGITSFVFVKNSLDPKVDMLNRIKKIFNYEVKRGYGGNLGNKGSIVSGFQVYDTIIFNFSSHLAANDEKRKQRLEDVQAIFESLKEDKIASHAQDSCDYMFFTGDLNFRLSSSDEEVRGLIQQAKNHEHQCEGKQKVLKNQILKKIFQSDQFAQNYKEQKYLGKFIQKQIDFYPTYRYVKNGTEHDTKRKPGWCDRILYRTEQKSNIYCSKYSAIDEVKASDHRAVIGVYRIRMREQNKQKKQYLVQQYLKNEKQNKSTIQQAQYSFPKSRYNY